MRDSRPDYGERDVPTDLSLAAEFLVSSALSVFNLIFDRDAPVVSISDSVV